MKDINVNMTEVRHNFSLKNKLGRIIWTFASFLFFKPFVPRPFRKWRIFVLRCFGAKIGWTSTIHSSVIIWAPWNLVVGEFTAIGPGVDCYNQGKITIGSNATVSQKAYLCASSHDFNDPIHSLVLRPIEIKDRVWIAADAFIGPGVIVEIGAVVGARAAVFKNVMPWTVVGGNPAIYLKERKIISKLK
ncbi:putative colanic acid biosynthesis acetyltransferase [Pedobacter sp. MC2016-05]|uniref:putative colanic acid biosynthesis acetyltransferase n=1 Tax=Pedobacter sp. MC2016-05 TaxID=2994474 RepID=UPI002245586F|nr:putative colanic acid biosynthesis acetyltransferase [Pedobacter sp. MC2016-05]MCX2473236.1 putative colanic acid biosynthesis acetyltransferase [Pedobacter sp. MC2016-05]